MNKKITKTLKWLFALLLPLLILITFLSVLTSCGSKKIKHVQSKLYHRIIKDIATDDCPALFFGNTAPVTLTQIMMMGLADLFYSDRNSSENNDVIFMLPQSSVYDYNTKTNHNASLNFNWLLDHFPNDDMLKTENLINHQGKYMFYTNTNNFQADGYHHNDQGFYDDRKDDQGYSTIIAYDEYLDNILKYYDENVKFDIFMSNLNFTFYFGTKKYYSSYFYQILNRANHIYLLSEGSTDWVTNFNDYKWYLKNNVELKHDLTINGDTNYQAKWDEIFTSNGIDEANIEKYQMYDFYDWQDKVTMINIADANYWKAKENLNWFKQYGKKVATVPATFDYRYSTYYGGEELINNAIEGVFKLEGDDFNYYLDPNFNTYDPNKKSLIFLTGKEWNIIPELISEDTINYERKRLIANCINQEMQDFFNQMLIKYPLSQYNYIISFHPRLDHDTLVQSINKVLRNQAKNFCVIGHNYIFEPMVAKSYKLYQEDPSKAFLFDFSGNYEKNSLFAYQAAFAGYDIRSTTFETILTMFNYDHLNDYKSLKKTWCLVSPELNFMPSYFANDGSGTYAYNNPTNPKQPLRLLSEESMHNYNINYNYLHQMELIGLSNPVDSYKYIYQFTNKDQFNDYIMNYDLTLSFDNQQITYQYNNDTLTIVIPNNINEFTINFHDLLVCDYSIRNVNSQWSNSLLLSNAQVEKLSEFSFKVVLDNDNVTGNLNIINNKTNNPPVNNVSVNLNIDHDFKVIVTKL